MILFKIQFEYKGKMLEGSVWELETTPKQWHVTIEDDKGINEVKGVYIVHFDEKEKLYKWGFPDFDTDHSFMRSLGLSLRDYLWEYGWNSVTV